MKKKQLVKLVYKQAETIRAKDKEIADLKQMVKRGKNSVIDHIQRLIGIHDERD